MKVYIDLFFLFNVIMDVIVIVGVSILLKRKTSVFRIVISSLIGGIASILMFTVINKLLIELISIFVMVFIAYRYVNIRYTIRNIFYMYILSVLLGGVIYLFNVKVSTNPIITYFIIIIIAVEVMILYIKEIKKMKNNYNNYYKVVIVFRDGAREEYIGFVDTGNNLYDPYKSRPIILLSYKYYRDDNFVLVPYYTAGGESLLKCVKPDMVYIDGMICKKNVLVGFSESVKLIDGVDVILHKDIMKG